MRYILLLVCLLAISTSALDVRTWDNGASDGDINNGTNYDPDGALDETDSLVFGGSVVADATMSAPLSVGYVRVLAAYTGAWSQAGHRLTVANGMSIRSGGAVTLAGITKTADGDSIVVGGTSCNGAVCTLDVNGTTTFVTTLNNQVIGGGIDCADAGDTFLMKGNGARFHNRFRLHGGTFTHTENFYVWFDNKNIGNEFTVDDGTTINGTATIWSIYTDGLNGPLEVTFPKFKYTGSATIWVRCAASADTITFVQSDTVSVPAIKIFTDANNQALTWWKLNGKKLLVTGAIEYGSDNTAGRFNWNGGASTGLVDAGSLVCAYNKGNQSWAWDSATYLISGAVTMGSVPTITQGDATLTLDGTADATLTTAGKALPHVRISKTSTGKVTAAGHVNALSFGLDDGKFDAATYNIVTSGNMIFSADTLFAGADTFRITGDGTFRVDTTLGTGWNYPATINTRTASTYFDSTHLDLQGNDSVIIRKFALFPSVKMAYDGKTIKMTGNMEYPHALNVQDGLLTMGAGTLIHSNRIFLRSFTGGNKFNASTTDMTASTGEIYLQGWNGQRDTLPAINMPLGALAITGRAENAHDTVWITGDLSATYLAVRNDGTKNLYVNWGEHTYTFPSKTDGLTLNGNSDGTTPVVSNFGAGTFDLGFFGGTSSAPNNKAQVFNYGTANFTVSGNIRIQPNTTTDGGGAWTIDSAGYIKSSGTAFGTGTIDAGAGVYVVDSGASKWNTVTATTGNLVYADSLSCTDFTANNTGDTLFLSAPILLLGDMTVAEDVVIVAEEGAKILPQNCDCVISGTGDLPIEWPAACGSKRESPWLRSYRTGSFRNPWANGWR